MSANLSAWIVIGLLAAGAALGVRAYVRRPR
jgi:hypothetical protein